MERICEKEFRRFIFENILLKHFGNFILIKRDNIHQERLSVIF